MERPESRSSALPRMSRLPQAGSGLPRPGAPAAAPVANTSAVRPARQSTAEMQPPSGLRSPPPVTASKRSSMLARPGFQSGLQKLDRTGITSPPSQRPASGIGRVAEAAEDVPKPTRRPRPSLSDRAADTLSTIPPSPASRRQSAFYGADSPLKIRPPSRAESALGHARPGSRIGSISGVRPSERPISPSKRPGESGLARLGATVQPKRSVPAKSGVPGSTGVARGLRSPVKSTTREQFGGPLPSPSKSASLQRPKTHTRTGSKAQAPGHARSGSKATQASGQMHVRNGSKESQESDPQSHARTSSAEVIEPKTSSSLKEAIAQAKAAHKASGSKANASVPRAATMNFNANFGPDTDPNALDFVDSAHMNILKKRISNARTDGKLNIASLCLTEIPYEVLHMHEGESDVPWYETVDVTRLLASDNELTSLPEELFPSEPLVEDSEAHTGPFPNLQTLDLHGNKLTSLPQTLANMNIQNLVLGGNRLAEGTWEVLTSMRGQRQLELGKNNMSGPMPSTIAELINLELLDVHDNQITEISSAVGNLIKLKKVIVNGNKLTLFPLEAVFDLPLSTILAARNKLSGSLFPKTVPMFEALVELDVSHNALTYLAEAGVKLPKLRRLDISHNRIMELPDVSAWQSLEEINAEENKISAFPEGFDRLKSLISANFANNSLLAINPGIGFLDKLVKLEIQYNPIKERRLMRMDTEQLKSELRSQAAIHASEQAGPKLMSPRSPGSVGSPTTPTPWVVNNGTIDRSNTRLASLDAATVEAVAEQGVKALILHHNQLPVLPPAIELLGGTLTSLDLANNKLGKSPAFLGAAVCLSNLTSLNLTSNGLTTLDPLTQHLSANRLATLIVPFNRIEALPENLTRAFPALKKLLISNNKIVKLNVTAVKGLEVLDISSNDLEALPAELGLLKGQLRTFMAGANRFKVPGWNVLQKGTDEILEWCRKRLPEEAGSEAKKDGGDDGASSAAADLEKFTF